MKMFRKTAIAGVLSIVLLMVMAAPASHAQGVPTGPATEINVQIIGLTSIDSIPLTALPNQTSYMSPQYEMILRSPGNSTYSISANGAILYTGYFSYITTIVNTTSKFNGLYVFTFSIYSSALGFSETFNYSLDFTTVTNYIHYVSQKLNVILLEFTTSDLEGFGFAIALLMGILMPSFTILMYKYKKNKRAPLRQYAGDDFRHRDGGEGNE